MAATVVAFSDFVNFDSIFLTAISAEAISKPVASEIIYAKLSNMNEETDELNDAKDKSYIHIATLQCALTLNCIPCHYKIFPLGSYCSVILPPNQRPEQCTRAKSGLYNGLYKPTHRVLTLGDGDFSFSLCIA
jgi:hypothetical protein